MLKSVFFTLIAAFLAQQAYCQKYELKSPNGRIHLVVQVGRGIVWSADLDGKPVLEKVEIGMDFTTGEDFGVNPKLQEHSISNYAGVVQSEVPYKNAVMADEYAQLTLAFKGEYQLLFRAYNDGVAYRFVDDEKSDKTVRNELLTMVFPAETRSLFPQEESMYSHNERLYLDKALTDISAKDFCSLPVMFTMAHAKVLFTETALYDYPGMFVRGNGSNALDAVFPPFILEAVDSKNEPDRIQTITKQADYIAEVSGQRAYPWRVFMISDDDRTFVASNLPFLLSKPNAIGNTSWIKPGKVAWDWYNANNIFGVDFKSGLNTATYKYYIDFAAENGIEYVILDEGWTKSTTEILDFNPDMDVRELIRYGNEKGVGLILWVLWKPLDANLVQILETYKSWGAKGVKIDFMQRNDQYMVRSYERIAREAARLELLVDFHGAFKPSGLQRPYPNVLNHEGVKGSENNKWSKDITPAHNVTLPFTRMAAGPMDYTPGCMVNRQSADYAVSFERPMSQGTRAHQVAMYVVYEAPLQMLCESPAIYRKEQETVDFITQIPTTWDETRVLQASVGNYIAVARRKGDCWYIGAMTNGDARTLELDLSFLADGPYAMQVFKDGVNAARFAEDFKKETIEVNKSTKISANLAPGGGWSAVLKRKEKG